jgi:hypothetical protein
MFMSSLCQSVVVVGEQKMSFLAVMLAEKA